MTLADVPSGLAPMQYAAWMCENTLGIPAKGNVQVIAESIEAISKNKLFRGREEAIRDAFFWLNRRAEVAKSQGERINNLWFMQGSYWEVEKPVPEPKRIRYERHGEGYGYADIWELYRMFEKKCSAVKRDLSQSEIDGLLDDLDKKRGGSPAWRQR